MLKITTSAFGEGVEQTSSSDECLSAGSFGSGLGFFPNKAFLQMKVYGVPTFTAHGCLEEVHWLNAPSSRMDIPYVTTDSVFVGLFYKLFKARIRDFDSATEEAYSNREALYNIIYHLMGHDWTIGFKKAVERGNVDVKAANFFADILRNIGLGDGKEPRYPLSVHAQLMGTMFANRYPIVPVAPEDFDALVSTERHEGNTTAFIQACMVKGGLGYLMQIIAYIFGPYHLQPTREEAKVVQTLPFA